MINPKYSTYEEFEKAVFKRANAAGWEISKTLNQMNLAWIRSPEGRAMLNKKYKPEQLAEFEKKFEQSIKRKKNAKHASDLPVGPWKYTGLPIGRVRAKTTKEVLATGYDIKPSGWKPFKQVAISSRAFGEQIPWEMQEWFFQLEEAGTIPEGTYNKYAKWIKTVNEFNEDRATQFSKRVGEAKYFNKGHLAAILNNTYFGGSNDPASQILELKAENIAHGAKDAISLEDMRKLDLPTNWGESAAYFMVNELGIKDNRILTGTGLPMRWSGKDMILDSDIARITRFGENADVILAETQNRIEQLAQEIEANRAAGLGDAESLKQIQSRMVDGRYVAPTIAEQTS